ncbi:MAG TPA: PDZ domain-containing protein [bacterium]|nr:PDZ domain-containing protein [bacterium]
MNDVIRGQLGLEDDVQGVRVDAIKRNSDAYREGIEEDDIITHVNSDPVPTVAAFRAALQKAAGDYAKLTVRRQIRRGEWVSLVYAIQVPAE